MNSELSARAEGACELCSAADELSAYAVAPRADAVALCGRCLPLVDAATLEAKDWSCLRDTIWSTVEPVQVLSFRLLGRLKAPWASELLDQVWLEEETRAWAEAAPLAEEEESFEVVDINGTPLARGDSVCLTRSLDVKGTSFVAKRGTVVRNIRLSEADPTHIEGKVNGTSIYIKTCYLKKVT